MTEQETFVRAVCENPGDDTVRLVYADWLEERDEPAGRGRGAFVRYQCAYSYHEEHNDDPFAGDSGSEYPGVAGTTPYEDWPDSAWTLFEMNGDALRLISFRWRRGFIDSLTLGMHEFFPRAKKLFRNHPIEAVEVTGKLPRQDGPRTFEWLLRKDVRLPTLTCALPIDLRPWLKGYRSKTQSNRGRVTRTAYGTWRYSYPTAEAAKDDLNAACVRYGRFLAGLPQLRPAVPA